VPVGPWVRFVCKSLAETDGDGPTACRSSPPRRVISLLLHAHPGPAPISQIIFVDVHCAAVDVVRCDGDETLSGSVRLTKSTPPSPISRNAFQFRRLRVLARDCFRLGLAGGFHTTSKMAITARVAWGIRQTSSPGNSATTPERKTRPVSRNMSGGCGSVTGCSLEHNQAGSAAFNHQHTSST